MSATRLVDALVHCNALGDVEERGECGVAARTRHRDYSDCTDLESERWHNECLLLRAGAYAAAGDFRSGLATCQVLGFREQCLDQVIGPFAMRYADADADALDAAWGPISPLAGPRGDWKVWEFWHSERVRHDLPLSTASCPYEACEIEAQRVADRTTDGLISARGCAVAPPGWAAEEDGRALFAKARARRCGP